MKLKKNLPFNILVNALIEEISYRWEQRQNMKEQKVRGVSMLSNFKWYRKWRGGWWYHCVGEYDGKRVNMWVNGKPPETITIIAVENYNKK